MDFSHVLHFHATEFFDEVVIDLAFCVGISLLCYAGILYRIS